MVRLAVPLQVVVGVLFVAVWAMPALAENFGRRTGPHEQVTTEVTPAADVDDYVFEGAPGWQLNATVKKGKTGDLAPVLELVAPDGTIERVGTSSSKAASLKKVTLATGGGYALRVRGTGSTTGAYTLVWSLKPDKGLSVKSDAVGANVTKSYSFAATPGSLVSWSLKYKGDGGAQVVQILDPQGSNVPFSDSAVQRKGTTEKAKNLPLGGAAGGMYVLRVRNDFAPVTVTLAVKVKMAKLPKVKLALTPLEPALGSIEPSTGGCSTPVSVTGLNLGATLGTLRLGAGAVSGASLVGGTTVNFLAPGGTGVVDLVYTATDGQVAVLADAFTYVPAHTVTSIEPTGGSGSGGQLLTITGTGFRTDIPNLYQVLVGGTPAPNVTVQSPTELTCVTPAHVAGTFDVVVRDTCGTSATSPVQYTYGLPPFITLITPAASPTFGGVSVLVSGVNLSTSDTVYFDGEPIATTPFLYQGGVIGHTIAAVPAKPAGKVDIEIRAPSGQSSVKVDAFAYFDFTDVTASTIPAVASGEDWGGVSNAVLDKDGNGSLDWLVIAHTDRITSTRGGVRVLNITSSGAYTDATSTVMPAATPTEAWGANRVLGGRLTNDNAQDLYLSRPGTGDEANIAMDGRSVIAWGRILHNNSGVLQAQPHTGSSSTLVIPGLLVCNATWACAGATRPNVCYLFDYDFRSTAAAMGDLDGDLDQDVVLLNDRSIARFVGVTVGTWVSCEGNSTVDYQYYTKYDTGSALRILSTGSTGGMTDRTASTLETDFDPDDDHRGVGLTLADITGDGLRDIVITHNQSVGGGSPKPATRIFRQKNNGTSVTFGQMNNAMPSVNGAEDWRGDAVGVGDLNADLRPDLVIGWNGAPLGSSTFSTRILTQTLGQTFEDVTNDALSGVLPSGDNGRASVVLVLDFDKDGDQDIILSTPDAVGTGNPRTRLLLNRGPDPDTGRPRFLNASSVLPSPSADNGAAVAVLPVDIDGDGDFDLVLTDTYNNGNGARRTRIFRQNR